MMEKWGCINYIPVMTILCAMLPETWYPQIFLSEFSSILRIEIIDSQIIFLVLYPKEQSILYCKCGVCHNGILNLHSLKGIPKLGLFHTKPSFAKNSKIPMACVIRSKMIFSNKSTVSSKELSKCSPQIFS